MIDEAAVNGAMTATPEGKLGDAPAVRRDARRTMLPLSWCGREVVIERTDAGGRVDSHRGILLDWCVLGPVVSIAGARCCVPRESISLVELGG